MAKIDKEFTTGLEVSEGNIEMKLPDGIKHPSIYREALRDVRAIYPDIVRGSQQEINIATDIYYTRLRHPQKK